MEALQNLKEKIVPRLRFREFDGKWNLHKLGNGIELVSGQHLSPGEYNSSGEGFPYFTGPSDFTDDLECVKKWTYQSTHFGKRDEILITVKGNGVGAMLLLRLEKVAMGRQLMSIKTESFVSGFIYQYLLTKLNLFVALASGNMIPGLSRQDILSLKLKAPSLLEQEKIASFISKVDKRIQQLTRKKELLETYKKGVTQQLFSQEIRFKQNDSKDYPEWKIRKLGELGDFLGGGTPNTNVPVNWKGNIPWISSSDILEDDIHFINIHRYINMNSVKGSATKIIPKNSVLLVSRVGIGKLAVNDREICTSQDFSNFIAHRDNVVFLAYYLKQYKHKLLNLAQGTSIKGFTISDIRSLRIALPSISEQTKIANFLSTIDEKIQAASQQITKTKTFKKGLLQQMFV